MSATAQDGRIPPGKPGGRRRRRTETPIGKAEALEILQSALAYCQRAGLAVTFDDAEGGASFHLAGCAVEVSGDPLIGSGRVARLVANPARQSGREKEAAQ